VTYTSLVLGTPFSFAGVEAESVVAESLGRCCLGVKVYFLEHCGVGVESDSHEGTGGFEKRANIHQLQSTSSLENVSGDSFDLGLVGCKKSLQM
jgi:hypothetical protein